MSGEKRLNINFPKAISELESAIRDLKLRTRLYRLLFRGKGLEFDSFRDFTPVDDASDIDWKASKRSNKLLVKQYIEERDLRIVIAVDVSENMVFGSVDKLKCEYAGELASALAHLIMRSNDNVGILLYNKEVVKYIPPSKGDDHFMLITDKISDASLYGSYASPSNVFRFLLAYLDNSISGIVFISDFINVNKEMKDDMRLVAERFETLALVVRDPLDLNLPEIDEEIIVEDPATRQQLLVNPKVAGGLYSKYAKEQMDVVRTLFRDSGVDFLELSTDAPFSTKLGSFLAGRLTTTFHGQI